MAEDSSQNVKRTDTHWHLSKSVPITLIFTIFIQTMAFVWYFSDLNSAVDQNRIDIAKHDSRIRQLELLVNQQAVALGRIEQNLVAIKETLQRLEQSVNSNRDSIGGR